MHDPALPAISSKHHKASGSTDLMTIWKQRKKQVPALRFIVSISPASLSIVASSQNPLPFRPARSL